MNTPTDIYGAIVKSSQEDEAVAKRLADYCISEIEQGKQSATLNLYTSRPSCHIHLVDTVNCICAKYNLSRLEKGETDKFVHVSTITQMESVYPNETNSVKEKNLVNVIIWARSVSLPTEESLLKELSSMIQEIYLHPKYIQSPSTTTLRIPEITGTTAIKSQCEAIIYGNTPPETNCFCFYVKESVPEGESTAEIDAIGKFVILQLASKDPTVQKEIINLQNATMASVDAFSVEVSRLSKNWQQETAALFKKHAPLILDVLGKSKEEIDQAVGEALPADNADDEKYSPVSHNHDAMMERVMSTEEGQQAYAESQKEFDIIDGTIEQ